LGRVIIIVVAFLIMLGGVIGGLYYWGIDPLAKIGIDIGLAHKKAVLDLKPAPPPPSFVDFGLLLVPVVLNHEVKQQAELILRLQVPYDKKMEVAAKIPKLQAYFLEDMILFIPSQVRDSATLEQLPIRRRLLGVCDRVLGPGIVLDVVLEHAVLK
jgi:flagellar protein FliL